MHKGHVFFQGSNVYITSIFTFFCYELFAGADIGFRKSGDRVCVTVKY